MNDRTDRGDVRRDAQGRLIRAVDLLGLTLGGFVVGIMALVLFDGAFALLGFGDFGRANGWLAVILPGWLFVEDFRAWRYGPARVVAALVAAGVGVGLGLVAAGLAGGLPALVSGGTGALVASVAYALIWFYGVRWLSHRAGEG
ncbi:MAG TPA: hypothetical protein VGJ53_17270 [Micromonosporaceae bacterium]|jgi:hypothetical protein